MKYFEVRKARIEIIPMIDIMLFLLVFFILVTLHMIPDAGITSQLPTSSTAQAMPKPKITLGIDKDGVIHYDQKTLTPATLTALLKAQPKPTELQVTLAGDKDTSLQAIMKVMDACRIAGVTHIGLASKPVAASQSTANASQGPHTNTQSAGSQTATTGTASSAAGNTGGSAQPSLQQNSHGTATP